MDVLDNSSTISNATLVGSRELPPTPDQQLEVTLAAARIVKRLVELKVEGWSGGATGMDQLWGKLYAKNEAYHLFHQILPWNGFERFFEQQPNNYTLDGFMNLFAENALTASGVVWFYKISQGVQRMYRRNVYQVVLPDYSMSDVVFYYAPTTRNGTPKGGTAIAVRVAEAYGVPTFNLGIREERLAAFKFLGLSEE